jgi:protein-S-isoprenylcysteine O-methyltransferase Ste14
MARTPGAAAKNNRPPLVTGLVGASLAFTLFVTRAYYTAHLMKGRSGDMPNPLYGIPWLDVGGPRLMREFPDVLMILLLTFLGMAAWEKLRTPGYQRLLKLWFVGTAGLAVALCFDLPLFLAAPSISMGSWLLWRTQILYAASFVVLVLLIGAFALHHRRAWFDFRTFPRAAKAAFWRWFAGYLVLLLVVWLSLYHPLFNVDLYRHWQTLVRFLMVLHVLVGLPYCVLTHWLRYRRDPDSRDANFGLLVVMALGGRALLRRKWRRAYRILRKRWVRVNLLDLFCVKFFFLPLMVAFTFIEAGVVNNAMFQLLIHLRLENLARAHSAGYDLALHGILVLDAGIGAIGYACSTRWLGNKSKSVDPTMSGWVVALMCYPPFNSASGSIFPFRSHMGTPLEVFQTPAVFWTLHYIALLLYVVFVLATLAFGLRFSNMTHRGIIRHGPYAIVRHPAYISKFIAWWAETLPTFGSGWQAFGLLMFGGVYALRALTEERHLMADPEYRDYCRQVRWRFIPGLC